MYIVQYFVYPALQVSATFVNGCDEAALYALLSKLKSSNGLSVLNELADGNCMFAANAN